MNQSIYIYIYIYIYIGQSICERENSNAWVLKVANRMRGDWWELELELEKGVEDAISRTRFAPHSNNLLISSWDSVSFFFILTFSLSQFAESHSHADSSPLRRCRIAPQIPSSFAGSSSGLLLPERRRCFRRRLRRINPKVFLILLLTNEL